MSDSNKKKKVKKTDDKLIESKVEVKEEKKTNIKKGKPVLKIQNVSYRYKDAKKDDYVFKNLSFEFELGNMYAIKGKSGSGKTTFLSLISGLEKRYEGDIYYEDKNLRKTNLDKYRNSDIGIVFQSYNLLAHLTARENVILSMDINHLKGVNKKEKALELLKKVGLSEEQVDRRVLKLSGGEQQRVAIARSLSYNPKIIIADEPTGNLDKDTENDILEIFSNLAHKENKCIIIVTHSDNVAESSDIVYELVSKKKKNKDNTEDKKEKNKEEVGE